MIRPRLSNAQLAEMRQRRALGEKLSVLSADYGLCEARVCVLCRGVAVHGPADPELADRAAAVAAERFGVTLHDLRCRRRGRPVSGAGRARLALVMALRLAGVATSVIADALGLPGRARRKKDLTAVYQLHIMARQCGDLAPIAEEIARSVAPAPALASWPAAAELAEQGRQEREIAQRLDAHARATMRGEQLQIDVFAAARREAA